MSDCKFHRSKPDVGEKVERSEERTSRGDAHGTEVTKSIDLMGKGGQMSGFRINRICRVTFRVKENPLLELKGT